MKIITVVFVCIFQISGYNANTFTIESKFNKYQPNWDSLDTRPIPGWYDDAKIGIFLHWGVYSVPSFHSEWFWIYWQKNETDIVQYMEKNYPPGFVYQDFASKFTAEFYDPAQWAKLFKAAGAKYVILTSKHHEGYTLWPSSHSFSWNAKDVGPHRDLLGDLAEAVRNESLRMGFYYSLFEWFNPLYLSDKAANFQSSVYVDTKFLPELTELVEKYKPAIIWADGDWEANDTYWKSTEFLAWLYNESPVKDEVLVNDRWGIGTPCKHGDFFNCQDNYHPGVLQPHKWEDAMHLDRNSWGYRRNANYEDILTIKELIDTLVITVSCGGNICINIGPTKEGTIAPIFQERLLDLGKWLDVNGESIYETRPWSTQNDTVGKTWYTAKSDVVYAISLNWPSNNRILLGSAQKLFVNPPTRVELLGYNKSLLWSSIGKYISVQLPDKAKISTDWAWVLKIYHP